jgi:hypothetical protein
MPKRKKLRVRNDEDEDLLEKREEYAEDESTVDMTFSYGICDWCDLEHYLIELAEPYDAEVCQFCINNKLKDFEKICNKLRIISTSSP